MNKVESLIRLYIHAYNAMDVDGMLDCLSDDVVFENVSNHGHHLELAGKDAFEVTARESVNVFSKRQQTLTRVLVQGGYASAELVFEGVAAHDLPNGVKQGETLRLRGCSFFEIENGLIQRIADYS